MFPYRYSDAAYNYRYLDTDKSPDALMLEYQQQSREVQNTQRRGQWVWNTYGKEGMTNPDLFYQGRDYDRTYRILADEFYRTTEELP